MEACVLPYIPERLHTNERPEIPIFEIGECLFYRCHPDHINEPFDGIRLYDLSTNRQGNPLDPLSYKEDVLYNINPENGKGEKLSLDVLTLQLIEVSENKTYENTIEHIGLDGENNPITNVCKIKLLHDRLPCNYSHSIFRVTFNGIIVNEANYNTTLKKKSTHITQLRTRCKVEFERLIREGKAN